MRWYRQAAHFYTLLVILVILWAYSSYSLYTPLTMLTHFNSDLQKLTFL